MSKPMRYMLLLTVLLFGGVFGFYFFKSYMIKQYLSKRTEPPVTVATMQVSYQNWQPKLTESGSLRAIKGVNVTTELAGLVKTINFTPGTKAEAGQLLVELNTDADVAQLHALQANADLANTTYKRDKAQYAIHAISKATLDTDADNLKSLQAQVAQQQATIAKKMIRAPFTGYLGVSNVNPGQYVNTGNSVVSLQTLDPIYVDFYVPQQSLVQVSMDQAVTVTSDTYPGVTFTGKVTTIEPQIDTSTRNVEIEATIDNPDLKLRPGMFVQADVNTGEPKAYLTVPQSAISYNPYGDIVYVVVNSTDKDGKAKQTVKQVFVTLGDTRGDQVAVLDGLKDGETIVVSGQLKLKNGSAIKVNNELLPANSPNPHPADA